MSHIARSALIIAVFFGLEKALGFVRQVMMARTFGLSTELDTFNAANNLPDLLFILISGGTLGVALIPVLSEYLEKRGRPQAWELFSRIANLVFVVTAGFSILVAVFAEPLVRSELGVAPGFNAQQQDLVVELMRLNLLATLLFSLSGLVMAGLQANQHFLLPAIAPSMYDLGALFGILILAPEKPYTLGPVTLPALGLGVQGLVYGVILGAALFLLVQVPGLFYYRFRYTFGIDFHNPGVRQVLGLLGPRVMTMFFIQMVFIAQDNLASRRAEGSVAALVYGWLFMQVPESLIGTALGVALLPTISEQFVRADEAAFRRSINQAVRVILALTLPAAALLATGIEPVIGLLNFDAGDTRLVAWTARAFLIGLVGHALMEVAGRSFYAQQDARTPLYTAMATLGVFIILGVVLASAFGAPGIGLANSIAFTSSAFILLYLLTRRYPGILKLQGTLWRALAAAGLGAGVAYLLITWLPAAVRLPLPEVVAALGAMVIGGLVALPFILPELKLLLRL